MYMPLKQTRATLPPCCLSPEMHACSRLASYVLLATTVAGVAASLQIFNGFYVRNLELDAQFRALRESSLCNQPSQRIASSDVNGCAAAERAKNQFSPSTLALLQTLQEMSLCGDHGTRCSNFVSGIAGMSFSLLLLATLVLVSGAWLLVQKYKIDQFTSKNCPLDTHNYPTSVPFYCNKLD